jgi:hypothetical protein
MTSKAISKVTNIAAVKRPTIRMKHAIKRKLAT